MTTNKPAFQVAGLTILEQAPTSLGANPRNARTHSKTRPLYGEQKNLIVWSKTNPRQGSLYRSQHELIALYKVGTASHTNNVELGRHGRNRSNVWTY